MRRSHRLAAPSRVPPRRHAPACASARPIYTCLRRPCRRFGAGANDLADGDSGVDGRAVRRRKAADNAAPKPKTGKGRRKSPQVVRLHGWEWDAGEDFTIERLIGRMVADGSDVPGRTPGSIPAGTVLYKVLWEGFPPEIATWEEEDQIPCGLVDFVAQYEAALAAEAAEDESDE